MINSILANHLATSSRSQNIQLYRLPLAKLGGSINANYLISINLLIKPSREPPGLLELQGGVSPK